MTMTLVHGCRDCDEEAHVGHPIDPYSRALGESRAPLPPDRLLADGFHGRPRPCSAWCRRWLGPADWRRYLNDSRIVERTSAR